MTRGEALITFAFSRQEWFSAGVRFLPDPQVGLLPPNRGSRVLIAPGASCEKGSLRLSKPRWPLWPLPLVPALAVDWESQLRLEYPSAVQKLESSVIRMRCKATTRYDQEDMSECFIYVSGGSKLVVFDHQRFAAEKPSCAVFCLTPNHYFCLRRSAPDKRFAIKSLDSPPTAHDQLVLSAYADWVTKAAFTMGDVHVKNIIESPSCQITNAADVSPESDGSQIKVSFRCDDPALWVGSGSIVFVPARLVDVCV